MREKLKSTDEVVKQKLKEIRKKKLKVMCLQENLIGIVVTNTVNTSMEIVLENYLMDNLHELFRKVFE